MNIIGNWCGKKPQKGQLESWAGRKEVEKYIPCILPLPLTSPSSLTGPFLHRQPVPARAPYIVSQLCSPFILTGYSKGKNHGLPAVRLSMTSVTETGGYPKKVIQTVEICQIIDRAVQVSKSWLKSFLK